MLPENENPLAGPNAPPPEHQFYSLGFLCQQLQQLPPQVEAIAESAGVTAAMVIDAIPYYRGSDVQRMAAHVANFRRDVERQAAAN